jgi:DNA-binding MarR family transcriptional regulator
VSLERHGPLTLGQLATLERVKPPSITRMVVTLESAGLVHRESDPADRRVTVVNVTAEGRRTLQKSRTRKTAYLAKRLRGLDDAEAATLDDALRLLERILEND